MKNLILLTIAASFFTASYAANITAVNNGPWSTTGTWDLNRVPATGDVVIIPAGKTVSLNDVQQYSTATMIVNIFGTLNMVSPGKIDMAGTSIITVFTGGRIVGSGSPSETIKIGGIKKFDGTTSDIVGPMLASSSSGAGFISFGTLPVVYTSFTVTRKGSDYQVAWATAQETGSDYFEVERSEDGQTWKAVSRVQAAGNATTVRNYSYTDRMVQLKTVHYRVKQADLDGRVVYTSVQSFKNNNIAPVYISGSQNGVSIRFTEAVKGNVTISLVSFNGQEVVKQVVSNPQGAVVLPAGIVKGQFVVTVRNGNELVAAQQVIL